MKLSKWRRRNEARRHKAAALDQAEARLDSAIDQARASYAGILGRPSVWDNPKVRAAKKHRDHILRDLGKIAKRAR